ncbi:MAG: polyribonucleotide nucleotidyltransferase [Thermoanaerobaculia bacterium]|nr:polyribonucleotide nucleotidyltransferase [Thermoanaerobaculia bacterium]MCZ7651029.1 polyribonucleotide nucleotidyltransferase [Thermoanaerobaculia bacterium]
MKHRIEIPVGGDRMIVESGHLAKQANGSCVVRYGDTVVLTTACMATSAMPRDFLPLTVDYREYTYAAGRIPGGFFKREGRPTEKETITCRLIDRPLRPLFPPGYTSETQVISLVLSADGENDPDVLAINGASFALVLSNIPFYHPIGAVRVGLVDGEVVFNPTNSQRDVSELDLVVVGTEEAVVMVEAGANQLSEELLLDCIWKGHQELQKVIKAQIELFRARGLEKPTWTAPEPYPQELYQEVRAALWSPLKGALHTKEKFERKRAVSGVVQGYVASIPEDQPEKRLAVKKIIETLEEEILRDAVLRERIRFDSRRLDEIRPIAIEVGLLPRTHGSALFTRGETQALASVTLGTKRDAQILEEYEGETLQKFMLHYNFPPFSVGEVKFLRSPGRREIGHGVLARRALMPVLPHGEEFPYTVRVVSDILESNGSSSMATICGGSLALFDAGVPILAPVAGVAMGLIKENDDYAVLSDIAGQEDHYGDMDFKVAGTAAGITALQMDIKITGITREIMGQALAQARAGRLHILGLMGGVLANPRAELSLFAPRLHTLHIPKEKIRDVIGAGGKTVRSIVEETGCEIEIENDGRVIIASPDGEAARRAIQIIERLTETAEIGKVYTGTVRRVEAFGAFVEILPGTDGLVHVSELAPYRVREVTDILKEGDEVQVKVIDIDDSGRVRLSRKAVIMESPDYDPAQYEGMGEPAPAGGAPRRDERGGRRDRDDRGGRGGDRGSRGGRGGRGGR